MQRILRLHDVADDDDDVSYMSGDESVCCSEDVDYQHENDVEFNDVDEIAPFLAADEAVSDLQSQILGAETQKAWKPK